MTIPLIFAVACVLWMLGMTIGSLLLFREVRLLRRSSDQLTSEIKQFRGVAKLKDLPNEQRAPDHLQNGQYRYGGA